MNPQEIIKSLESRGIKRYQISKDTGISEANLHNWYTGKTKKPCKAWFEVLKSYFEENK